MANLNPFENTVFLLIDLQKGFMDPVWGLRNNPNAEENATRILDHWRKKHQPIIHAQHLSLLPGSPLAKDTAGCEFMELLKPISGERIIQKSVNSAFIGTDLEKQLREHGYKNIVIAGLTTPHCVSTTARMAANLGFNTLMVSDATAAFGLMGHDGRYYSAEEVHNISLATLNGEFATIVSTDEILSY